MDNIIDYVVYGDTDSVVGGTEIVANNKKMKISDYFESVPIDKMMYRDDFNDNYVKEVDNDVALSLNTDTEKAENKKIKYVMKHKVKKQMYRLKWNGNEVVITEDHSIVVKRNDIILSISPKNIQPGDKIFGIFE